MAELVDALASGASECKLVEVQVLSRAPGNKYHNDRLTYIESSNNIKYTYRVNRFGLLAQLARASRLHRGGRGFESLTTHHETAPSSEGVFS